jgi:glycosyltransferase involved in cell wall biosynthesis
MLTIAIDAQPLQNPQKTGHAYYVEALLETLEQERILKVVKLMPETTSDLSTLERYRWDQRQLPRLAAQAGADILITTAFSVPKTSLPTLAVVHDLSLLRFPQNMKGISGYFLRKYVPSTFKRATKCIAISECTKNDMVELLGVKPEKISVVYSGVDTFYKPVATRSIQAKLGLEGRYFVHVGTIEPRKNVGFLIEAIADVLKESGVPLVLVGKRGWLFETLFAKRKELGLENLVIEAGYVTQEEKRELYSHAIALLYPSTYEGFGMPILEAMACSTPVIASNVSSIPEVVGDAGILLPLTATSWKETVETCLADSSYLEKYKALGLRRAGEFTWEKTAKGFVREIEKVGATAK